MAAQDQLSRSADADAPIQVRLLGPMRIEAAGRPIDIASRKARALLAFVALRKGTAVPRGVLTALLWSDRSENQARASLRQALSELRSAFAEAGVLPIEADNEAVRWRIELADVDAVRLAEMASVGPIAGAPEGGELMEGFSLDETAFEQWLAGERERVRQMQSAVLLRLMEAAEAAGTTEAALGHGLALLVVDPLQERVHRSVMRLYDEQGRSDAALAQYERLKTELARELGVQPEEETVQLARAIKSGRRSRPADSPREEPGAPVQTLSLAVLPFLPLSDDRQHGFFADGMTEDIIGALSRIGELFVIARSSSFAYRNRQVRAEVAARELGVRYILEGSVRVAGSRVRVNAQLIDGTNGGQIWAERFDGNLDDIFAVQDEITRSIAVSLQVTLTRGESARIWEGQTRNLRAWEAMTLGRRAFYRFTTVDNFIARQHLLEAIRLDPTFPAAIAQLGMSYYWDARYSLSMDATHSKALAQEQVDRLAVLAPETPFAYNLRAYVAFLDQDYDGAIGWCERAVQLAPSDSRTIGYLGLLHTYGGDLAKALHFMREASRLSPHPDSWITYFTALALLWTGDLHGALDLAERYLALDPDEPYGYVYLAIIQHALGRKADASQTIERLGRKVGAFRLANVARSEVYRDPARRQRIAQALIESGLPP